MKQAHHKKTTIAHFVGLSGIGGVQSNFVEYMKSLESHNSRYQHRVYTLGCVDPHYQIASNVLDIRKISNLYKLILDLHNDISSFISKCNMCINDNESKYRIINKANTVAILKYSSHEHAKSIVNIYHKLLSS